MPNKTLSDKVSADGLHARVSFSRFESAAECISTWPASDCKHLFDRLSALCNMTWQDIKATGGKSNKTGFAYTTIHESSCKVRQWPRWLSKDESLVELRVGGKKRIFGVRHESTLYLIWLDRNHLVMPFGK